MSQGFVLFFTPEAGVIPHFAAQALLARMVMEKGHQVLFVRCQGHYSRCPVMDMHGLPHAEAEANRAKVCGDCVRISDAVHQSYGFESVDLKDFLDARLEEELSSAMAGAPRNLVEMEYDGVPFGKLASLDFVLSTKVSDFGRLSQEMRSVWELYIRNSILTYLLLGRLLARYPVKGLVHHEDYSMLLSARLAAEKLGIPCTHIGFPLGMDRQRMFIMQRPGPGEDQRMMAQWDRWRDLCLTPAMVRDPMDDLLLRMGSPSARVYSPKKTLQTGDLHGELGLDRAKKLLVAFTSSLDERLACDHLIEGLKLRLVDVPQPFADQIAWLEALVRFVGERDGYQLVVRIHPREIANKRDNKSSQHLERLKAAFDRPLRNAVFVWPEQAVSSYDLAELADLVLTAWTTLGLEMGRVAVPVLASTYGLGPRPDDDFHAWAPTPEAYFARIDELTRRPPALETVLHAFRWHLVLYQHHSLDFSDLIPAKDYHGFLPFRMPREGEMAVDAIVHRKDVLDLNRARLTALQIPGVTAAEERRALRVQLRRALHFFFTGEDRAEDCTLVLVASGEDPEAFRRRLGAPSWRKDIAVALTGPDRIHYLTSAGVKSRVSPLCRRLALLGCHHWMVAGGPGAGAAPPPEAEPLPSEDRLAVLLGRGPGEGVIKEIALLRDGGRLAEARQRIAHALSEHGEGPALLNLLGHVESLSGNDRAAMGIFERIGRDWPAFAKAHLNLALMSWNRGDHETSLLHLANALEHGSEDVDVVRGGVRLLKLFGLDGEAEALLIRFARSHPAEAGSLASILLD